SNLTSSLTLIGTTPLHAALPICNSGSRKLYTRIIRTGQLPTGQSLRAKQASDVLVMNVRYTDAKGAAIQVANLKQGTDFMAEVRSEEHTSELQSRENLVCRLLLE